MRELFSEFIESIGGRKKAVKALTLAVLFDAGAFIETNTAWGFWGTLTMWITLALIFFIARNIINKI